MRTLIPIMLLLGLVGCQPRSAPPAGHARDRLQASVATGANLFDPSRLEVGDTLLGLRVVSAERKPSLAGPGEWTADVRFSGEIELTGELRRHPVDPESPAICFFPDSLSSRRLPRLPTDTRRSWLCLEEPDSVKAWTGERRRARIVVDDFRYVYAHTDVFNTARLVRVLE